ncbi:MAG: hypothetical protein GF331_26495 [Chitinivibrionales bacterium]|nr:hypothetical protein [Chitinivibrionales bacterium]
MQEQMKMGSNFAGVCPALLIAILVLAGCGTDRVKGRLANAADSVGYAVGLDIGESLDGALSVPLDFSAFAQGIHDTLDGDTMLIGPESRDALMERFARELYGAPDPSDRAADVRIPPPGSLERVHSLETNARRMSYAVGVSTGAQLRRMGGDVGVGALMQGVIDTLYGRRTMLERKQALDLQRRYVEVARTRLKAERARLAAANAEEAERWLEANARKAGVHTTTTGLQYSVLREGAGRRPDSTARVRIYYTGRLIDSTVFDSSYASGEPRTVVVGGMMRGWVEGLQLMREGAVYRFFVPPALGFGEQGRGDEVPRNALLIYDMELVDVLAGPDR